MREALKTDYQSISDMEQGSARWKNFFVQVAGKTGGAHKEFVGKLKNSGQNEVYDPDQSDYIAVFCPIASRVGTDIGEALADVPDGKPIILVVMHHTFDRDLIVAESRRQVDKAEVLLTVDCLFQEGKFLPCNRNDIAWGEIKKTLGLPTRLGRLDEYIASRRLAESITDYNNYITRWLMDNKWVVIGVLLATVLVVAVIILVAELK